LGRRKFFHVDLACLFLLIRNRKLCGRILFGGKQKERKREVLIEEPAAYFNIFTKFWAKFSISSCVLSETLRSIKLSKLVWNLSQAIGPLVSDSRIFNFGDPPFERITGV